MSRIAILCEAGIRYVYPQVPDLAELLARDGHHVDVFAPFDPEVAEWNAGRGFNYVGLLRRRGPGWAYNLGFLLRALPKMRRYEHVIATTTVTLTAALWARLLGKRAAFYALECQIPGERSAGFFANTQRLLRFAGLPVAATGRHRARAMQRFLRLRSRPAVVENSALLASRARRPSAPDDVRGHAERSLGRAAGFLVVLNGGLGLINGLDVILDALALLPPGITVAMFGPVSPALRQRIDAAIERHRNAVYLGVLAGGRAELISYLRSADLGLVLKRCGRGQSLNDRLYTPSKLYDFIAAGVYTIASPNVSLRFVYRDGLGLVLERLDAAALAASIARLAASADDARASRSGAVFDRFRERLHFERDAAPLRAFARN